MANASRVIVLTLTYSSTLINKYTPSFGISTGEGIILLKDCLRDTGIWLSRKKSSWWNQRFSIENKTTCIDLFKLHVRCFTLGKQVLGRIYESNRYCNDKSGRETTFNEVDTTDGNTASIEGQGLNVLSQQRNKKSAG